ncbi:helix-turn-helix domain-containing protein [Actinokineospora enzanensis]|uniref:helix-turn-helix domain-containing protein n=1 Tax=Actinokineospora enzanensis TaxID=155975 RepID=UPI00035DDF53|nr:helix-turn-helix domain-containing protein [Actinokineospora enzanensis]
MQYQRNALYRVKAVAEMLDVSPHTIYRAIGDGRLDAVRIGRVVRITAEALAVFLDACGEDAYQAFVVAGESVSAVDEGDVTRIPGRPATTAPQAAGGPLVFEGLTESQVHGQACVLCGLSYVQSGGFDVEHFAVGQSPDGSEMYACRRHPATRELSDAYTATTTTGVTR